MKTLLLSSDDIQNFRKLIYDPKVANLGNSNTEDANLMALQYYLKHPGNYTSAAAAAAATTAAAAAAAAATITSQVHIQQHQHQRTQHPQTQSFLTAAATTTTAANNSTHNNNHTTSSSNNNTQPNNVVIVSNSNSNGLTANATTTSSHHAHHHLLAQSQTQLKQLQLKQPTIHHHQHTASFHHPYYQQHSTPAPPAHTSHAHSTTHSYTTHSLPVHALNQNSNFSAASSSTGGGTASSHAATHTTGSSLSPPGTNASARTTPSSGGSNSSGSSTSSGSSSRGGSTVSGAKKLKVEPVLSQFHQNERLNFANSHINWTEDHWRRVVFQDERKFNLDGPDGFSYYFHDLRNYEKTLSQRPRGNSVYIYLVLTAGGPIHLEVSTAKFKIESCVETLLRERANIVAKLGGNSDFYLQDHNWTTNALPSVQEWLNAESIKTQKWPTVAHDLNIMEGIWGWLIREVFDGGRKFSRKDDLIFRIREAWSRVPMELINNLYTTLSERITQLYYTRGAYTNC
ncbi:homeobox protein 5 [Musca vetustissima]|uniref:homeobox protein 5 n=1 Tax=Musca vetustissima TaxID=27455 RepID=UPI002AB7556D|nr:homeobox protein 5 [Musca vetustissima]